MDRRVVVTGLGMLSGLGNSVKESWAGIVEGKSGVANITEFDAGAYNTRFSAMLKDFDVSEFMPAKDARKMDAFIQYGMVAGIQAFNESGLVVTEENADRIGVLMGTGIGGLDNIEKVHLTLIEKGPRKVTPFFVPGTIANMIGGNLSIMFGLRGFNFSLTSACTTGTHAIGVAAQQIQLGVCDAIIAGGAEKGTTALGLAGFSAARALSKCNDDPQAASRPWDKDRDGFVLGDGAGALVLEEYEHAKARGATIYAELAGFGMSSDAYHMTLPSENGVGAGKSMMNALKNAGMNPEDIQYINAHGTSTQAGDVAENQAVKTVFGDAAKDLVISSTKSMTGHLLGAAGAIEAVFSILAIHDQLAPPTINLDNPDDGCDLDYAPHQAKNIKINAALSNSFGFGGTNGSLIFKKV